MSATNKMLFDFWAPATNPATNPATLRPLHCSPQNVLREPPRSHGKWDRDQRWEPTSLPVRKYTVPTYYIGTLSIYTPFLGSTD